MNDPLDQANNTVETRLKQLQRWLFDVRGVSAPLKVVSADASFRQYYRVQQGATSFIVMDAPPVDNKNQEFLTLAKSLNDAGINAPEILACDLQRGFVLMEDFGDNQYLESLTIDNADELYSAAIRTLIKVQSTISSQNLPVYDKEFLNIEMHLFPEWYFAKHRGLTLSNTQTAVLESVFSLCTESALEQPMCFVHRDYHSRNLMLTRTNSPGILDFQDAVRGPLTYDIASLLKDCYISWPDDFVYSKLEEFREQCVRQGLTQADKLQFQRWFDLMALQRHIKVMGIFCRLKIRDDKPDFMHDLPMVFHYIKSTCQKYPELRDFQQLLDDTGTSRELT